MTFITEHFLGTTVNFLVVLILGALGSLIRRSLPERITDAIMKAIGVCVVYIGIDGVLEAAPSVQDGSFLSPGLFKALVMIISMVAGTLMGELVDLDKWLSRLGDLVGKRWSKAGSENFSKGFITCSLIFCVGALTVNGAIADAQGDPSLLFAKSVLDGVTVLLMSSTYGIGCAFSAFFLLIYQGVFTALAMLIVSVVTPATLTYMSVTGSLIVILLGTNVLGITKVKTANMVPAIFVSIGVEALLNLIF